MCLKETYWYKEKGLGSENTSNQNGFSTSPWSFSPPLPFSSHAHTNYVWLSLPLPYAFPSQDLQMEGNVDNFPVFQMGNSPKTNPDIKARPKKNLLVLDRRLLHLGDLMHPLSARCISCVRSFSACRLWSPKFPYPAANLQ